MSSGARVMRSASLLGLLFVGISIVGALGPGAAPPCMRRVRSSSERLVVADRRRSCFCSGFIIFLLGIVLEYLALLVLNAHGKPIFFIADRRSDAILVAYFAKGVTVIVIERETRRLRGAPGRPGDCAVWPRVDRTIHRCGARPRARPASPGQLFRSRGMTRHARTRELSAVERRVLRRDRSANQGPAVARVDVIWAAGRSRLRRFRCSEAAAELVVFRRGRSRSAARPAERDLPRRPLMPFIC